MRRMMSLEESRRVLQFLRTCAPRDDREAALVATIVASIREAMLVPASRLPRTVVTMYSTVKIVDIGRREAITYTLVYPGSAREYRSDLSLLTPLGAALLGASEGSYVAAESAGADVGEEIVRMAVKEVLYQPEWDQRNRFSHDAPLAAR